jgi:hypothetical protein
MGSNPIAQSQDNSGRFSRPRCLSLAHLARQPSYYFKKIRNLSPKSQIMIWKLYYITLYFLNFWLSSFFLAISPFYCSYPFRASSFY